MAMKYFFFGQQRITLRSRSRSLNWELERVEKTEKIELESGFGVKKTETPKSESGVRAEKTLGSMSESGIGFEKTKNQESESGVAVEKLKPWNWIRGWESKNWNAGVEVGRQNMQSKKLKRCSQSWES